MLVPFPLWYESRARYLGISARTHIEAKESQVREAYKNSWREMDGYKVGPAAYAYADAVVAFMKACPAPEGFTGADPREYAVACVASVCRARRREDPTLRPGDDTYVGGH